MVSGPTGGGELGSGGDDADRNEGEVSGGQTASEGEHDADAAISGAHLETNETIAPGLGDDETRSQPSRSTFFGSISDGTEGEEFNTLSEGTPSVSRSDLSITGKLPASSDDYVFGRPDSEKANTVKMNRFADLALKQGREEKARLDTDRNFLGMYAKEKDQGHLKSGHFKCNLAVHDWGTKAGLKMPRLKTGQPANTAHWLKNRSLLSCWKETQTPKRGGVVAFQNPDLSTYHMGVITAPKNRDAVSAGRIISQERRHWGYDKDGVARPIKSTWREENEPNFDERPRAHFFDYVCDDMGSVGARSKPK